MVSITCSGQQPYSAAATALATVIFYSLMTRKDHGRLNLAVSIISLQTAVYNYKGYQSQRDDVDQNFAGGLHLSYKITNDKNLLALYIRIYLSILIRYGRSLLGYIDGRMSYARRLHTYSNEE